MHNHVHVSISNNFRVCLGSRVGCWVDWFCYPGCNHCFGHSPAVQETSTGQADQKVGIDPIFAVLPVYVYLLRHEISYIQPHYRIFIHRLKLCRSHYDFDKG